jgi:hypothetical protein
MAAEKRRNRTPPEIARQYRVANAKVIDWIRKGELAALNLARHGCTRPRYSVTPEALDAFERARAVIPRTGDSITKRLRRQKKGNVKEFF